jgi:hypothetical protein
MRRLVIGLPLVLAAACAPKLTPQQALVEEAFAVCQPRGPSTRLERVDPDGRFTVVGRESETHRVHECMVRYDKRGAATATQAPATRAPAAPPTPSAPAGPAAAPAPSVPPPTAAPAPRAPAPPVASATETPRPEPLAASRLPGIWRGTLKLSARAAGEADVTSPAAVRFVVAAGTLHWTLAAGVATPTVAADGTAVVVDGVLRMTGTVRPVARPAAAEPPRSTFAVRYSGTLVGDRLEVTGVTSDKQVHVLSIRRTVE